MKTYIDGHDLTLMMVNAAKLVDANTQTLNDLNVFPVPDGDTGTNMAMTLNYALPELQRGHTRVCKVADIIKSSYLRGAHGNSGVITSLLFRGFSDRMKELDRADASALAEALSDGVAAAYKAVLKPTEGTILTVSRLAAAAATACVQSGETDIIAMLEAALKAAGEASVLTPTLNPVLAKAGVIDAGGLGYCYILEGMLAGVRGEIVEGSATGALPQSIASGFNGEQQEITFTYCTEFIIMRENTGDPLKLRAFLDARGDSLVLVDDDEIVKIHVHTNNPGLALEEAMKYGALTSIKIENMREQHTAKLSLDAQKAREPRIAEPEKPFGFVSISAGEGLSAVMADLGVDHVVEGGQTMNPSTEDILNAVNLTPAETVFILPNNKNIIYSARLIVDEKMSKKNVIVIPSSSIPEGLTALLAFEPDAAADVNETAMVDALKKVRTGTITYAARDSAFDGIDIKKGQYLALAGNSLAHCSDNLSEACAVLAQKLDMGIASYITIFSGADADEATDNTLKSIVEYVAPSADLTFLDGGQPVYYYIIGVE